jgi:hypothetical protein
LQASELYKMVRVPDLRYMEWAGELWPGSTSCTVLGGQIKRILLYGSGPCLVRAHELYCWVRTTEVYLMVRTVDPYCKVIVLYV